MKNDTASGRASPAAAVPEGALPPLPKPWNERMCGDSSYEECGVVRTGWAAHVAARDAEIAEWRARAAVSADRAQQGEPVADGLVKNLRAALAAADAEKYDECAWDAFQKLFNRDLLDAATKAAAPADALPAGLFDSHAVYSEITRRLGKGHCHNPDTVSATLDALVRLMRRGTAPVPDTGIPTAGEVPSIEDADLTWAIAGKLGEFYPQETPRDMEKNHRLARAIQRLPLLRQTVAAVVKAELASRCREGRHVPNDNDNFRAPVSTTPTSGAVEKAALLMQALTDGIELKEPVYIGKALRAHRLARVCLSGGTGPLACVMLCNIQLTPWIHTEETAKAYAEGYNNALKQYRGALLEVAAPSRPSEAKAGEDA